MTRFRFRLEPVLEQRRREEDRAAADLARGRLALEERQRAARMIEAQIEAGDRGQRDRGGALDLRLRELHHHHRRRLVLRLQAARRKVEEVAARVDALQATAAEASRRRQVVERLRERQEAEHRAAQAEADRKAMDELAVLRSARAAESVML